MSIVILRCFARVLEIPALYIFPFVSEQSSRLRIGGGEKGILGKIKQQPKKVKVNIMMKILGHTGLSRFNRNHPPPTQTLDYKQKFTDPDSAA